MLMKIVRKILVFFAATSLASFLFLLVLTSSFSLRFGSSDNIKKWLRESGTYESFVGALLEQSTSGEQNEASLPIDDPKLIGAARQAFNPAVLSKSTESILDGVYGWLRGETATPEFRIDLTEAKESFADATAEYAADRYETLPDCSIREIPSSVDPFQDTCRVSTLDRERVVKTVSDEIAGSQDLLGETVFTAESFGSGSDSSKTVFQELSAAPKIFRVLLWMPLIVGGLSLLCVAIIVYGSDSKRKGLRRVAITSIISGVLVVIAALTAPLVLGELDNRISVLLGAGGPIATDVVNPLFATISKDTANIGIAFGVFYVIFGIASLIALFVLRGRFHRVAPPASKIPHSRRVETPEQSVQHTPPTSRSAQPSVAVRDTQTPKPVPSAPELPKQPNTDRAAVQAYQPRPPRPSLQDRSAPKKRNLIQ